MTNQLRTARDFECVITDHITDIHPSAIQWAATGVRDGVRVDSPVTLGRLLVVDTPTGAYFENATGTVAEDALTGLSTVIWPLVEGTVHTVSVTR